MRSCLRSLRAVLKSSGTKYCTLSRNLTEPQKVDPVSVCLYLAQFRGKLSRGRSLSLTEERPLW